jgi:CubicO group peptidase (beta-lactamase class C family)
MKILAATLVAAVSAVHTASGQQQPAVSSIDSASRAFADSGFTGVVVIRKNGHVMFRHSYGSVAQIGVDSKFWIGSITKSFTAAAILRLAEQRRLQLGDSIGRFIRDVPGEKRGITIRQLLTHTSGIDGNYAGGGKTTRAEAISAILAESQAYRPGTHYQYMDDDYELLAAIVEIVSGTTWERYVKKELVSRAGLHHTAFWTADEWGHKGANGMSSTADDLLLWVTALRSARILTPKDSKMLEAPQILVRRERGEDVYYGYAVRVYMKDGRVTEVMHSGSSDDGNTAIVRILENGLDIVVLSRGGDHGGTTWSSYVAHRLPLSDRRNSDDLRTH